MKNSPALTPKEKAAAAQGPQELFATIFSDPENIKIFLDSFRYGVLLTDPGGYIVFMNKPYGKFLGLDSKMQIGRHVTDVIENTRMHIVGRTGKAEINETQIIRGKSIVVQRIPIIKNGQMLAVFGIVLFECVTDLQELAGKVNLLQSKVKIYEKELMMLRKTRYTVESIISQSESIAKLKKLVFRASAHNLATLITGESGCGKELFAQAIHNASARSNQPFVRVNASAIPSELLESELFGYSKGAFTGAKSTGKPGKFHLANNGTIFFDEIGDLSESMQPKLLRVLEEKEFEPVGSTSTVKVDFRLIAATNRNLEKMVSDKRFRADLYYRLNVFHLHIPPLRERPEDIMPQVNHFLCELCNDWGVPFPQITSQAQDLLKTYAWPGNSRELRHLIQKAMALLEGDTILPEHFNFPLDRNQGTAAITAPTHLRRALDQAAIRAIRNALHATGNNKVRAARMLGIHRTFLYRRMNQLGIEV